MTTTPLTWLDTIKVNTTEGAFFGSDQINPQVATNGSGQIFVVWEDHTLGPNHAAIRGQLYDPFGNTISGEVSIAEPHETSPGVYSGHYTTPEVVVGHGQVDFRVAYNESDSSGTPKILAADLTLQPNNAFSKITTTLHQFVTSVSMGPVQLAKDSSFYSTLFEVAEVGEQTSIYTSYGSSFPGMGSSYDGTAFDNLGASTGVPDSEGLGDLIYVESLGEYLAVTSKDGTDPSIIFKAYKTITPNARGDVPIALTASNNVVVNGNVVRVIDKNPTAVELENGNFIIGWESYREDGVDGRDLWLQMFEVNLNNNGQPFYALSGSPFKIADTGSTDDHRDLSLFALGDGGFMAVWTDHATGEVEAQRFQAGGTETGSTILLDTLIGATARNISGAELPDGRFVVTWESRDIVGTDYDIVMKIMDPRSVPNQTGLYPEKQIIGTPGDDTIGVVVAFDEFFGATGNDVFTFSTQNQFVTGDLVDGGDGFDTLRLITSAEMDLRGLNYTGIEALDVTGGTQSAFKLLAQDMGSRYVGNLHLASVAGSSDSFQFYAETPQSFDGSAFSFGDWQAPFDTVRIYGGAFQDTLIGTSKNDFILGYGDGDILRGGAGDDDLQGHDGTDYLYGEGDNDTLHGGEGDDFLDGGDGIDTLNGGNGNDTADYSRDTITAIYDLGNQRWTSILFQETWSSIENVRAGDGDDLIFGDGESNELSGGAGNDRIFGGDNDDFLEGFTDDDYLDGGKGADRINGDVGNDTVAYVNSDAAVTIDILNGTYAGGDANGDSLFGIENIIGSAFNDTLQGDDFNNVLEGGNGDDAINGGGAMDTASYESASAAVVVSLATQGVAQNTQGAGLDTLTAIENLTGSAHGDQLTGDSDRNVLSGNSGNDMLDGGVGADTMNGGFGDDVFVVDNAGDVVFELSGEGNDIVDTTVTFNVPVNVEVLRMQGTGDINSTGTFQRDQIFGNAGENIIDGAGGFDVMAGGAGNDTYAVDNSSDAVIEMAGEGFDNVYSSVDYIIDASQEIESAILTGTATVLRGDESANQLFGNDEINVIDGRGGTDFMLGQGGADIFQINLEAGAVDVVADFSKSDGDRMAFTGFNQATTFVNQASATSFEVRDTKGTADLTDDTVQTFQLWDSYDPANPQYTQGALVFGIDYYFG